MRKVHGTVYSLSIMDLTARMSQYEDELWTLGLVGGMLEASPPIEIGDAAGIHPDELDGFMPGMKLPVQETGHIKTIDMGTASGTAGQWANILDQKGSDLVGLGGPRVAPRVAAAGIIDEASKEDLRTLMYVNGYEQYCLMPIIELFHAYNKQFLTKEKAIRSLGIRGDKARTIRTIRPDQIGVEIFFEPQVGRKMKQRSFQAKFLLNLRDRFMMSNQMDLQMGRSESYDIKEMDRRILHDGAGIVDVDAIIPPGQSPSAVLTAPQEHRLFSMGQRFISR